MVLWFSVLIVVVAAPRVMLAAVPVPSMMRTLFVDGIGDDFGAGTQAGDIGRRWQGPPRSQSRWRYCRSPSRSHRPSPKGR